MNKTAYIILRVGLAVTFIWIGILILMNPEAWGSNIQPWAANLLPVPLIQIMTVTAILDIAVGVGFLINPLVWLAALLGALHVASVLLVSGVTDITVRDIAILAATVALTIERWPGRR